MDKKRTFGLELEFADADKTKIILPNDYSWTDGNFTVFVNSNGAKVTNNGQFGGEINTRPLKPTQKDFNELKSVINNIRNAGGNLIWFTGFDGHIYVKDLGLNFVKKAFECSYYISSYLKEIFDVPEWFDTKYQSPSPTFDYVKKLNSIKSEKDILKVFANSSQRGHYRFYINIVPFLKHGTIEFRFFNSSWDFNKTKETIKFMYSFVEYVKNHDTNDFKKLKSVQAVLSVFNINPSLIPKRHKPLIFAAHTSDNVSVISQLNRKPNAINKAINETLKECKILRVVNTFFADVEQFSNVPNIVIYTKELCMLLMYEIILDNKLITYTEPFNYSTKNKTKAENLAYLFFFNAYRKTFGDDVFQQIRRKDFELNKDLHLKKLETKASKIIKQLSGKNISIVFGDIETALNDFTAEEGEFIFYQSEFNIQLKAFSNALEKYTDEENVYYLTDYSKIDLSDYPYIIHSENEYLPYQKIAKYQRNFVYSNIGSYKTSKFNQRSITPLFYKKIPNNYIISRKSKIKFIKCKQSELDYLRAIYLKKDILQGSAPYNYLWFIDDYLIGGCSMGFSKRKNKDGEIAFMLTDLVIDSKIPKLSKLLIYLILSKPFKKELDVRYKSYIKYIETAVFSESAISMKYRGVYKKVDKIGSAIIYQQNAGKYSYKEILANYCDKYQK